METIHPWIYCSWKRRDATRRHFLDNKWQLKKGACDITTALQVPFKGTACLNRGTVGITTPARHRPDVARCMEDDDGPGAAVRVQGASRVGASFVGTTAPWQQPATILTLGGKPVRFAHVVVSHTREPRSIGDSSAINRRSQCITNVRRRRRPPLQEEDPRARRARTTARAPARSGKSIIKRTYVQFRWFIARCVRQEGSFGRPRHGHTQRLVATSRPDHSSIGGRKGGSYEGTGNCTTRATGTACGLVTYRRFENVSLKRVRSRLRWQSLTRRLPTTTPVIRKFRVKVSVFSRVTTLVYR